MSESRLSFDIAFDGLPLLLAASCFASSRAQAVADCSPINSVRNGSISLIGVLTTSVANIPGRRSCSGLAISQRTRSVRVAVSTCGCTRQSDPGTRGPDRHRRWPRPPDLRAGPRFPFRRVHLRPRPWRGRPVRTAPGPARRGRLRRPSSETRGRRETSGSRVAGWRRRVLMMWSISCGATPRSSSRFRGRAPNFAG